MRTSLLPISLVAVLASAPPLFAHEFWISPERYSVAPGEAITAEIRVGQNFEGAGYAYFPMRAERFDLVVGGEVVLVEGRLGDRPALNQSYPADGLVIVVHETTDNILTYTNWEQFQAFVEHKDLEDTLARHTARGLPETGFGESYRRYAKSLIAVGSGEGVDREVGLETEIVAGMNPYTGDLSVGMPVQVLFQGKPRADAQIELFAKDAAGEVTITLHRTDAEGRAVLPVAPGTEYLVDAVKMIELPNDDPEAGPVWKSLWASLTFRVPD